MKSKLIILIAIIILIAGCTKIDYIGEEYLPTNQVDVYYDQDKVNVEYEIMGQVIATGDDWVGSEKMLKDIKKKAMEKGADGIIIQGMERYISGEKTTYTEEIKEDKKSTKTIGTTKTETEEKKEIKAIFIKYK